MPPCCTYNKRPYIVAMKRCRHRLRLQPAASWSSLELPLMSIDKYRTFVKKSAAYVLQNPTHSLGSALASYLTVCSEIANIHS